jgi:hypothetical protein
MGMPCDFGAQKKVEQHLKNDATGIADDFKKTLATRPTSNSGPIMADDSKKTLATRAEAPSTNSGPTMTAKKQVPAADCLDDAPILNQLASGVSDTTTISQLRLQSILPGLFR